MINNRKKITAYLHPSLYQQDKKTIDFIEGLPHQIKGDFYRQAIITAAALSEIDSRLLGLISTFYSKKFDVTNLLSILEQIVGTDIKNNKEELITEKNIDSILLNKKLANLKK